MASEPSTLPLNATDLDSNVDEIDKDIAATISEPEVAKEASPGVEEDASGLIASQDTAEPQTEAPATTNPSSVDTAKSLNESNNKIIKELDDETTKTFPQVVRTFVSAEELVSFPHHFWFPNNHFFVYKADGSPDE